MRAIVCGGREIDSIDVWNWLERFGHQDAADAIGRQDRITCIIRGGARGADEGGASWGRFQGGDSLRPDGHHAVDRGRAGNGEAGTDDAGKQDSGRRRDG